jgi:drug/metabolite transporter (DMT)-like permease
MRILAAYLTIIALWSTTPLAIKWSGEGVGAFYGLAFRISLGLLCVIFVLLLKREQLPLHKAAVNTYLWSALSICGSMGPTYWAVQYIPSGWISVLFGLSPLLTAILASIFLNEISLTPVRVISQLLGLSGLAIVFGSAMELGSRSVLCIVVVVLAVALYSICNVSIKRLNAGISGISATTGGLIVSLPFLWLFCLVEGSPLPVEIPTRSLLAIIYLGVLGTAGGFSLYYFILKQISAVTVSMITLITPVLALLLGSNLNDEVLTWRIMTGACLIIAALVLHEILPRLLKKYRARAVR